MTLVLIDALPTEECDLNNINPNPNESEMNNGETKVKEKETGNSFLGGDTQCDIPVGAAL